MTEAFGMKTLESSEHKAQGEETYFQTWTGSTDRNVVLATTSTTIV